MAVFDSKNIYRQYAEILKSIAESEQIKKTNSSDQVSFCVARG